MTITTDSIQEMFRAQGYHVPSNKRAQAILDALPIGSVATGWTEGETLDVCLVNYENGAVDRLLELKRGLERRQAHGKRTLAGTPRRSNARRKRNGRTAQ